MYTSSEVSHVLLSAKISKETDRYAPWVNTILKTVRVDDIRKPSPLNILAQRNDPNQLPIRHGSDKSYRKPDVVFMTEKSWLRYTKSMRLHRVGGMPCLNGASTNCLPGPWSGGNSRRRPISSGIGVLPPTSQSPLLQNFDPVARAPTTSSARNASANPPMQTLKKQRVALEGCQGRPRPTPRTACHTVPPLSRTQWCKRLDMRPK